MKFRYMYMYVFSRSWMHEYLEGVMSVTAEGGKFRVLCPYDVAWHYLWYTHCYTVHYNYVKM
jgi:hypothetical protein